MKDLLAPDTAMAAVMLFVRDLDAMTRYYRDALTLDVLDAPDRAAGPDALGAGRDTAVLGRAGVPVMVLRHAPDLPARRPGEAGLFHTAIVFDGPAGLAHALASVVRAAPATFTGSADHLVSEAFYFTDPEGNGVELYHDRPRSTWAWETTPSGREDAVRHVQMATIYLDPREFLAQHLRPAPVGASAPGAIVGHVHLQVGDVSTARTFYVDVLGFEETAAVPGALFVSAGGYHHHLAMNTWGTRGAGPRASALGLGSVSIEVPAADDLGALADRLAHAGVATSHDGAALRFDDPWLNRVEVSVRA